MNVKRNDRGSVTVVHLDGQLDLFTAKDLRQVIATLMEEGRRKLILDFEEMTYLDSSGVGVLLLDQNGNTFSRGRAEDRTTGIATHSHDGIRCKTADDPA